MTGSPPQMSDNLCATSYGFRPYSKKCFEHDQTYCDNESLHLTV